MRSIFARHGNGEEGTDVFGMAGLQVASVTKSFGAIMSLSTVYKRASYAATYTMNACSCWSFRVAITAIYAQLVVDNRISDMPQAG